MVNEGAGSSAYQSFAKVFTSYHDRYAAGPSNQIDSPVPYDVVLDEDGGMVKSLMDALEVV
jgi:nuclear pore complex protein Nup107